MKATIDARAFVARSGAIVGERRAVEIGKIAEATIRYLKAPGRTRGGVVNQALEDRWYASLSTGSPDYSIYAADEYLAELWACWAVYSSRYVRALSDYRLPNGETIALELSNMSRVVDLGCGLGETSAALAALFPAAVVVGTNLQGTTQYEYARRLSTEKGFKLAHSLDALSTERGGLVFASEYFEHFQAPVAHLREVLTATRPDALVVANTFGARSIGHFDRYIVEGREVSGVETSRAFSKALSSNGYRSVKTGLWNNRPNYWKLSANRPELFS